MLTMISAEIVRPLGIQRAPNRKSHDYDGDLLVPVFPQHHKSDNLLTSASTYMIFKTARRDKWSKSTVSALG